MSQATVILTWTFDPPNCLEKPIEIPGNDYVMTIADGKAEARIAADLFDRDCSIRQTLHNDLNGRLFAAQLLTDQPYRLSESSMVRIDPDGKRTNFSEMPGIVTKSSFGIPDFIWTDKDGNVRDTRRERIGNIEDLTALMQQRGASGDGVLLDAVRKSYRASRDDPDNELMHLYEIRDAFVKKFGEARER